MKCIFLTLSNRAVFRNLFFFPGSLYYKILQYGKAHPDFRVVIMVPHKDLSKYKDLIAASHTNTFVIEPVKVRSPNGILERAFYFFYSYLIYTGTTKVLATMAMRPDEPPAGGNRFFAPLKWFISGTFGRIFFMKRTIVPFLFKKIMRDRPFKELFLKYMPDKVFASHLYGWFDAQMIREANEQGINSAGMPAGWDHLDKYFLPLHVNTLCAQSEEIKNSAIKYQAYEQKSITITGYPHFDFIADQTIYESREKVLSELKLPANARYMMYISGSVYCPDEPAIIEEILSWMKAEVFGKNFFLVIRPYSGGRSKDKEFDQEKFNRFAKDDRVVFYDADLWGNVLMSKLFMNVIKYTDVLLGMYTTLVLEAAVLDVPLLAAAFDGYNNLPLHRSIRRFEQFEHFKDVLKTGALPTAYNFDELKKIMTTYVKDRNAYGKERQMLREKLCGPLDGKSSDRLIKEILNLHE